MAPKTMRSKAPGKTTAPFTTATHGEGDAPEALIGLVVLWSDHEPARVGEVALFGGTKARILGRSDEPDGDLVGFGRQRPGMTGATSPPRGPGISRRQLQLRPRTGALVVERIGRCPMSVNGESVDKTVVVPGDTIALRGQMLLLVVSRPATLAALQSYPAEALGDFGEPDELGILGESVAAHALREQVGFASRAAGHVLVLGESGTGKELAARAIHALSPRAGGPLVSRNAATIPEGLIDAELFGNVKNYPNPGMIERRGLIGEADQGTLFLDEIGELSQELQSHLLRVLDRDGEYQRLGEARLRRADLRLVGATHRHTRALRHDLVGRLTLRVEVPPLSERRDDIPLLARHLLARARQSSGELLGRFELDATGVPKLDPALVAYLVRRDYVGNIRELEALLWRSMQTSLGRKLTLTEAVRQLALEAPPAEASEGSVAPGIADPAELDPDAIRQAIADSRGNLAEAARVLGLSSRYVLYRLLRKHGIEVEGVRS